MKIAMLQFSPIWENKEENLKIINHLMQSASDADLLIMPEMSLTGFTMNSESIAEEIDGQSIKYFIEKSRNLKMHIFAGIVEKHENRIFNSLFHFDNNGLIKSVYRKIHPYRLF